ncbi:MAG: serine/threonine-protein kinase [Gemmataceae bacterium]
MTAIVGQARNTDATEDYPGTSGAAGGPRPAHVELVNGVGTATDVELYPLLRRQLLIAVAICMTLGLLGSVVRAYRLVADAARNQGPPLSLANFVAENVGNEVSLAVFLPLAAVLWRVPPATVRGLRTIELLFFGLNVVVLGTILFEPEWHATLQRVDGHQLAVRQHEFMSNAYGYASVSTLLLLLYAVLIPNTWRRCAAVTGLMGAAPVVAFAGYATWVRPLSPAVLAEVLMPLGCSVAATVSAVAFASARIEGYRRQASEARRLGQYVLGERLGAGGMGEVYRAEHVLLRRPCAIKLIRPERASDPNALRRFEREVQATATLTHPNTVQVFDYGHTADGTFYYVMEYLPGLTLEEVVRRHGPLPPGRAVHFLRQVCAALGEAHARGLTHRDVKPGNVMVCERGGVHDVAKVLDFGLVRVPKEDPGGETLTREGTFAGTPAYMSPEQAGGQESVDPRSDIYSVGALAYFLLTGQPPFPGRSAVKMMAAHLYEPPAALPAGVPAGLAAGVMRCLAKDPAERWPDAASLDSALAGVTVEAWAAHDAAEWWERVGSAARGTDRRSAATSEAEPSAAADPAR